MMKHAVMRVARACTDIDALVGQYVEGLHFEVLDRWHDHDGFDGAVIGRAQAPYHLEFVHPHGEPPPPPPHKEQLLVFYVADKTEWVACCDAIENAGFQRVRNDNPYWERAGRTCVDREGGRVVLQNAAWTP